MLSKGESDQSKLRSAVIEKSSANSFMNAKSEWDLIKIYEDESHCVCGHFIVDNCVIRNRITGKILIIGNTCLRQFEVAALDVPKNAFDSLKRVREKPAATKASPALLEVAVRCNTISQRQSDIYNDIFHSGRQGTRSRKQKLLKAEINDKLIRGLSR